VLWLNPMTGFVQGYQHVLLQGVWPPLAVWTASLVWIAVLALALNVLVDRSRDQLVDWL
ncbi:ABC transporter, partial [Pseudomonas sp. GP01-A3]